MPDRPDVVTARAGRGVSGELRGRLQGLAHDPRLRAGLELFRDERDWINEQHLRVCRVPAPTFREQARAEHLLTLFRELGHRAKIDEAGNVILPLAFQPEQRLRPEQCFRPEQRFRPEQPFQPERCFRPEQCLRPAR